MRKGADDNLESFAKRIETRIRAGLSGSDSMERLICRLLTNKKNLQVSSGLAAKWVEWRYGKPVQEIRGAGEGGAIAVQIITNLKLPKPNA